MISRMKEMNDNTKSSSPANTNNNSSPKIWEIVTALTTTALIALTATTISTRENASVNSSRLTRCIADINRVESRIDYLESIVYWGGTGQRYEFWQPKQKEDGGKNQKPKNEN
jgi:hypothetical protein